MDNREWLVLGCDIFGAHFSPDEIAVFDAIVASSLDGIGLGILHCGVAYSAFKTLLTLADMATGE